MAKASCRTGRRKDLSADGQAETSFPANRKIVVVNKE